VIEGAEVESSIPIREDPRKCRRSCARMVGFSLPLFYDLDIKERPPSYQKNKQ
jgi:hypothetical protein